MMNALGHENKTKTKGIKATSIALSNEESLILKKAIVSSLSPKGFNLTFNYQDLVMNSLKFQQDLPLLWYKNVDVYIPDMEMDIEGKVIGAKRLNQGNFEVNIEFSGSAPRYWRECLFELWPI